MFMWQYMDEELDFEQQWNYRKLSENLVSNESGKWIQIVQMNEVDMGCLPNGSFVAWKIEG